MKIFKTLEAATSQLDKDRKESIQFFKTDFKKEQLKNKGICKCGGIIYIVDENGILDD
jgi:hypothetical protein